VKGKYEDSAADKREDARAAKKAGVPLAKFEKSGAEKKLDAAGQKRMNAKGKK
jgi:hypothetical protein